MELKETTSRKSPDKRGPGRTNAIPAQMDKSLFELIKKKMNSGDYKERDRIVAILEMDRLNRIPKNAAAQSILQLTYPNALDLADNVGIPLKDVIENMGIELSWPNEDAAKMAEMFDSMSMKALNRIRDVVDALSPAFWKPASTECVTMLVTPTKRMLYALKHRPGWKKDNSDFVESFHDDDLTKAWGDRKGFTLAPHGTILKVGNALGISPGWLMMGADGKHRLLSATPEAEYLMAGYLFMGETSKTVFKECLSAMRLREGADKA